MLKHIINKTNVILQPIDEVAFSKNKTEVELAKREKLKEITNLIMFTPSSKSSDQVYQNDKMPYYNAMSDYKDYRVLQLHNEINKIRAAQGEPTKTIEKLWVTVHSNKTDSIATPHNQSEQNNNAGPNPIHTINTSQSLNIPQTSHKENVENEESADPE